MWPILNSNTTPILLQSNLPISEFEQTVLKQLSIIQHDLCLIRRQLQGSDQTASVLEESDIPFTIVNTVEEFQQANLWLVDKGNKEKLVKPHLVSHNIVVICGSYVDVK